MLPIVGRHADAWHGFGSVDQLQGKWAVVARAAEEAGWSYLSASWPSEGKGRLDEFVEQVMPEFADS